MKLTHSENYRGHRIDVYQRATGVTVLGGAIPNTEELLLIDGNEVTRPSGPMGTTLAEDGHRIIDEMLQNR